eukprot:1949588-Pyramimonas_sp.AAC.1
MFLRKLEREGSFEAAGMIRNVLAAGFWTEDRLAKAGYESSTNGRCPRRGLEAETVAHRFWSCRCNDDIPDSAIDRSNEFKAEALSSPEAS